MLLWFIFDLVLGHAKCWPGINNGRPVQYQCTHYRYCLVMKSQSSRSCLVPTRSPRPLFTTQVPDLSARLLYTPCPASLETERAEWTTLNGRRAGPHRTDLGRGQRDQTGIGAPCPRHGSYRPRLSVTQGQWKINESVGMALNMRLPAHWTWCVLIVVELALRHTIIRMTSDNRRLLEIYKHYSLELCSSTTNTSSFIQSHFESHLDMRSHRFYYIHISKSNANKNNHFMCRVQSRQKMG